MALEEVSFINTNGEEINLSNIVNQMINYYNDKLAVGETRITDFSEGSEIRNLLEAFAIGIYALLEEQSEATKIAFISSSYGIWLDKIGELPFINLPRIQGNYAHGSVTFTLATAQSSDTIIPEETVLTCSNLDLDFVTTQECIIPAGDLSSEATVECLTEGEDGNVSANSIDTIGSNLLNYELLSVTNNLALEEGTDEEDDEEYRTRLLENVQSDGFGTQGYYVNICESVNGVHDVLLVNATGYTKKVLVNGDTKPTPDTVLLEVLTKLSDTNNIVLGHSFTVDKPSYTTINLAITMNVLSTISTDDLTSTLTALFNGGSSVPQSEFDGLKINQTLSKNEIISALSIFDNISEVTSIKQNSVEITTLTPDTNAVLKLGTVTFTQNEV